MYGELIEELISKYKPITTQRIHSILIDLIKESEEEKDDEIDLKGKINKYFDIKTDINNGSSIDIIPNQTGEFDSKVKSTGFSLSSDKPNEINGEITKDDKYWGFVYKLFDFLVNESDENIDNFIKDLYEKVKNDLTEISKV